MCQKSQTINENYLVLRKIRLFPLQRNDLLYIYVFLSYIPYIIFPGVTDMINRILDFFQAKMEIDHDSDSSQSQQRIPIATCALLLEMAHTDSEFNSLEQEKIISILQDEFNLSHHDASELIELSELERKESLDLWQFTNLINNHYSKEEKKKVLEILWHVVYADDKVDKYEEYLMRKLSNLLNMDHGDMIDAKFKARDKK